MKTKLPILLMLVFVLFVSKTRAENVKDSNENCESTSELVDVVTVNVINQDSNSAAINAGDSIEISVNLEYQNDISNGEFQIYYDGVLLDGGNGAPNFTTTINDITSSGIITIVGSPENMSIEGETNFQIVVAPTVIEQAAPPQLVQGINYTSDTSAILVLDAPYKEFVYVAGSFNNYTRDDAFLMKKDPSSDKFWVEITGLNPQEDYTYQYWVYDLDPIAFSPSEVKIADPYSTLVLSPEFDQGIPNNTYPNLPVYPEGQKLDVTVLQTGQAPYNWEVTNFDKPKEENLVIYEVLLRDFDTNRNFQDLINRIDYFKNLNINAIQLMPVMEFEGNEDWGYSTNYHMALDKFYGTSNKFKEFIDLCHQNDIAVILDIALDHASSRNPLVRMWMKDIDGNDFGDPSSENPYFNEAPMHTNSRGSDFNHQQTVTQNYVQRVLKYWTQEFNIDGFKFDNTKGFTQNCDTSDQNCTDNLQQDRIDILKQYADFIWSFNPNQYVFFDSLGNAVEEKQLADYKVNEGKGAVILGNMNAPYSQLARGFSADAEIENVGHDSRGFLGKRLLGFTENHNDESLMYNALSGGNTAVSDHNVQDLNIALSRMPAIGAASITIPGPKMIRQFSELGMDNSIYTCSDGSFNNETSNNGDCKEDTKPQPQWFEEWLTDPDRKQIYDDWSRLIDLKTTQAVFDGDYTISPYANNSRIRIYISNDDLPDSELNHIVIVCNFVPVELTITAEFPHTGYWYDLMDESGETTMYVPGPSRLVGLLPGQFKIYGNVPADTLSNETFTTEELTVYPNPVTDSFKINKAVDNVKVIDITGKIVKEFDGEFSRNSSFDISNLSKSMYIIQVTTNRGAQEVIKLVKS